MTAAGDASADSSESAEGGMDALFSPARGMATSMWNMASDKIMELAEKIQRDGNVSERYVLAEMVQVVGSLTAAVGALIVMDVERGSASE